MKKEHLLYLFDHFGLTHHRYYDVFAKLQWEDVFVKQNKYDHSYMIGGNDQYDTVIMALFETEKDAEAVLQHARDTEILFL